MDKYLIEENVDLKKYNTLKIGGKAKFLFSPRSSEELINYLSEFKDLKYFVIGSGSNLILPDEDYDGTIISLKKLKKIKITNLVANIEAGVTMGFMNNSLLKKGYTNFVWSSGIPGTLGGALIQNAGCYDHEIFDDLISVTVLKNGKVEVIKKEDIKYGYRKTNLKGNIILSADFKIEKKDAFEAIENMKNWTEARFKNQPLDTLNAGSTFKNPKGASAWKLIESANLKGVKIGGAKVSEKHANFVINEKDATSEDLKKLISHIQSEVKKVHGVDLELENEIINWK